MSILIICEATSINTRAMGSLMSFSDSVYEKKIPVNKNKEKLIH